MAVYSAALNDPQTVQVWGQGSMAQALHQTSLSRLEGKGSTAAVRSFDELEVGKGNRYRTFLRMQDNDVGVGEGEVLEGNESSIDHAYDDVYIGQFRKGVRIPHHGNISEQHVPFELRQEAKAQISDWELNRFDTSFMFHACGYTPANSLPKADVQRGYNTVVEYDANHRVLPGSGNVNDEDLGSSDLMSIALINKAVETAQTLDTPILPTKYGDNFFGYVCLIHPYQVSQLKAENSDWWELMKASMQGGRVDDNPLITGALGVADGVLFVANKRITEGVNSSTGSAISTVRRAVFLGANAFMNGYAKYGSRCGKSKWIEKMHDYDNELGVAVSYQYGIKRCIYNNETYGSLLLPTYAVAS